VRSFEEQDGPFDGAPRLEGGLTWPLALARPTIGRCRSRLSPTLHIACGGSAVISLRGGGLARTGEPACLAAYRLASEPPALTH
jgi:hypothetical protein